jgi:hypothetical protein
MSRQRLFFSGVGSSNLGPPKVGLPLLEHRTEVQKDDVILPNRQIWGILIIGSQSVAPRPHDAFVPIARDSIHAPGKRVDTLINPVFLALGRIRFCLWIAVLGA